MGPFDEDRQPDAGSGEDQHAAEGDHPLHGQAGVHETGQPVEVPVDGFTADVQQDSGLQHLIADDHQ